MDKSKRSAIIISASSDIGFAIADRWLEAGYNIFGTYRTPSSNCDHLASRGADLIKCDLTDVQSIQEATTSLRSKCPLWDVLMLCPGTQVPVDSFLDCDINEWEMSVTVNFVSQMRIVHELLATRRVNDETIPCVLFFAGNGTNDAPTNMSGYTISKIALIKMCELLDAEIHDSRFVIIGPGPVLTKIHEPTYAAGDRGGSNYHRTMDRIEHNKWIPMDEVLDCCDWAVDSPREVVSGRNISLVFDVWGSKELDFKLSQDPNMYKLRRFGNDWLAKLPRW